MRPISGLLPTHSGEYGDHRHGEHGDAAMSLKSKVDKLEKIIDEQKGITLDDRFSDWTEEELANYAINGIKPEGKPIGHISEKSLRKFSNWTDEQLLHYATTGEKPEGKRL